MSKSQILTANLLLSINRLSANFPITDSMQSMHLDDAAVSIFLAQLKLYARTVADSCESLGVLIKRKQRTIHFNADERFKEINSAVTLVSILVMQVSIILDNNALEGIENRADVLAGIRALHDVASALSKEINLLHNDVIAVI